MSHTTLTAILRESWIEPLKKLGRADWLDIESHPTMACISTSINWHRCGPIMPYPALVATAVYSSQNNSYETLEMFAYSKLLAEGPKILQPSTEHCEALSLVDINLSMIEYEQPFPVMLVEFPTAFCQAMTQQYGVQCPKFVILLQDKVVPYLLMLAIRRKAPTVLTLMSESEGNQSLETFLMECSETGDAAYRQSVALKRIALNLSLLLTRYGFVDAGPLDAEGYKRHKQLTKAKSKQKRDRARKFLSASLCLLRIKQDITFSQKLSINDSNYDANGSPKAPHWRRGHFRRQRVGVGRTESKLTLVKPILINADRFAGNLSDTEYRIRTRSS